MSLSLSATRCAALPQSGTVGPAQMPPLVVPTRGVHRVKGGGLSSLFSVGVQPRPRLRGAAERMLVRLVALMVVQAGR
jgi:hypothetical protein